MHTNHRRISPNCAVIYLVLLIACGSTTAFAQIPNPGGDALNQGVAAFKTGRYDDAIEAFKKALVLDPNYTRAKLYLGITYAYQVVPNLKTTENMAAAENAIATLKQIPDDDPGYHDALKQLASVYRNIGRLDEARDTELAALKLVPDDAETHTTRSA
jgi:tetratricopeptide (TPR) repeat protein